MKKSIFCLVIALIACVAFSCKKDDSTTTTPSLAGLSIEEDPVPFVAPGTTVTLKADVSYIYTSDDTTPSEPIGIIWVVSNVLRDTTTRDIKVSNPEFQYYVSDVGAVTITCYAYSSGYTNASTSVSFSAIDPETSLSGLKGETQVIDGHKFYVASIGTSTWLASNLYGTASGISYCLSDVTDSFLGKFYTWEEALTACPKGWKLPTAEEWDSLGADACALMTDATLLEEQMWTYWPGMDITNTTGFNAIPAGYVDRTGGDTNVQGFKSYAMYWTASEAEDGLAQYRYIYADKPKVQKGRGARNSLALSVRCIKE